MKKQLTFISILMVIIIAALTLSGLQLFGKGKVKPSEWFKKADTPQLEQPAPETASYVSSALFAENNSDNLQTYTKNWSSNFGIPQYKKWYNSAASTVQRWDYTLKGTFTCTKANCTDNNVNYVPCIRLELEDYDDDDMPYISESLYFYIQSSTVQVKYYSSGNSTSEIGSSSISGLYHTHSQAAALNSFSLSITESNLIVNIYSGSSENIISTASFGKSSQAYQKYLSFLNNSPILRFGFENSQLEKQFSVKVIETIILDSRVPVSLPENPTKEGHTFAGWYYGTQAEHGSSCRVYDGAPIYEDTALHAHFNINRYTVTYDVAGGTPIESEVLNWNTVASAPTPIRIGYNFKGWALADGSIYNNSPIKQNTTLTAKWEIKIFTVTFYVDNDNGEETYATLKVPYGSTLAEAMEQAEIISYKAMTTEGVRLSKQNTTITENTQVLVEELTGWEKYGDFVGRNKWFTWVIVGVIGALALTAAISITVAVKRK